MGKNRTIEQQFYYSIQNINLCDDMEKREKIYTDATGIEKDSITKRDYKKIGLSSNYIFSHTSMQNICSISKDFAKYIKEQGITKVNKITPIVAKGFLELKKSQGASPKTLLTYRSNLVKINTAIQMTFNCKGYCRGDDNIKNMVIDRPVVIDRRLSNIQISNILDNYKGKFALAFKIQSDFGLRVNEIKNLSINDFRFGAGPDVEMVKQGIVNTSDSVFIHSGTKGGLSRYVKIPADKIVEYRAILEQLRAEGKEKPFTYIDRSNYDKKIKIEANKLGYGKVGSSHEFRKYYSSSRYQSEINSSMTRAEKLEVARQIVKDLGHGRARDDLIKIYIGNL